MPAIFHATFKDKKHIFEVDDISTLKANVREEFHIEDDIRFQLFDKTWDDWVDVEIHQLPQRGKIRIISLPYEVTVPANIDNFSSPSSSLFSENCCLQDDPILIEPETANFISSVIEIAQEKESCQPASMGSPSTAAACHPGTLEEDSLEESDDKTNLHVMQQWPNNFTMPRPPILLEGKLQARQMPNDRERRQIVQSLFDYMAGFTTYPLSSHYSEAVRCLLEKYPFLGKESIPGARPTEYWRMKLMDKFRNERKHMPAEKRRKSTHDGVIPKAQVQETKMQVDDAASIDKFKKWMQDEARKSKQNYTKVSQMMEVTFKSRRQWILDGKPSVAELKQEYPCLFSQKQILMEMSRITPTFDASQAKAVFLINLEAYAAYLINSCQSKKGAKAIVSNYEEAVVTLTSEQAKEAKVLTALVLVPYYFKGEKLSAYLVGDKEEEPLLTAHPRVCFKGDMYTTKEIVVQAENELICTCTSMLCALCALICTYFTFDIEYPKECKNSLLLVETMLGTQKRTTRSVQSLIQKVLSSNSKS